MATTSAGGFLQLADRGRESRRRVIDFPETAYGTTAEVTVKMGTS